MVLHKLQYITCKKIQNAHQKSTDSPIAATSPRTQQPGKPEPSSMAAARRTDTIISESLKSARKRPTTCETLTPSGRSPRGVRFFLLP